MKNYWSLVRGHKRPARFVLARLLMLTGACRLLTIPQCGYRLRFHPANASSQLWIDPDERAADFRFLRDYLKPGDRVIDVGANVGETVMTAAVAVGRSGHVVGIEPHPRIFQYLRDNVRLNGVDTVELVNCAVGAAPGEVWMSDDRRDDMNRVGAGTLRVPVRRLDSLVPDQRAVALLKVDVEGYERFVFEGAPLLLARTACVFFEISAAHFARFGYRTSDLIDLLAAAGFTVFRIPAPGTLLAVDRDYDTDRFENLVALRDAGEGRRRTGWTVRERSSAE